MKEKHQRIEVKISAKLTVPLWTMGFLYTVGQLSVYPIGEFLSSPWYSQVVVGILLYFLWPFFLGAIHSGGL